MSELRKLERPFRRLMFAGGGNIGRRLAKALESSYRVKVIEQDQKRARLISEELEKTIVLCGDAADENLLLEENIENTDVFCALTNNDESNIMMSMLAKRMGAKKVIAIINRVSYVDLMESGAIDIAVSPQQITIGSLLTHVRRGDVVESPAAAGILDQKKHRPLSTSARQGRELLDVPPAPGGDRIGKHGHPPAEDQTQGDPQGGGGDQQVRSGSR